MTTRPATPAEDAVQLARSAYVRTWRNYWTILGDYQVEEDSPTEDLIFALTQFIASLAARAEDMEPQEVFDIQLDAARRIANG